MPAPELNAPLLLGRAQQLAAQGQGRAAENAYRELLVSCPDHGEALLGLGMLALRDNRAADALDWLSRATELAPENARLLGALGLAQKRLGQLDAALTSYRRARELEPRDRSVLVNLGRAERDAGRLPAAIELFRAALALAPRTADVWSMLSNTLRETGELRPALSAARQATECDPWLAEAHLNEGVALHALGELDAALPSYFVASLAPRTRPAALANLGRALTALGERLVRARYAPLVKRLLVNAEAAREAEHLAERLLEAERFAPAISCFEAALATGGSAGAHRELALLLWRRGHPARAFARLLHALECGDRAALEILDAWLCERSDFAPNPVQWERSLAACPRDAGALTRLGTAALRLGRPTDATRLFERLVAEEPESATAALRLGAALVEQGCFEEARSVQARALELTPNAWVGWSNQLFSLHFDPSLSPEHVAREHARFGALASAAASGGEPVLSHDSEPQRRLRIGYVSPDLCDHPVAYFLEPVLRHHDRGAFEIHCYSDVRRPDAVSARLEQQVHQFVSSVHWSDGELRARIAADRIDVLVDLAGHTARNRLPVFAARPSPVQLSWLGYFGTTGLDAIGYRIADEHSVPRAFEKLFVERVVRLPRSANCYLPPATPDLHALPCLTRGHVSFGCCNNPIKLNRAVFQTFARILQAVPESRLKLKYRTWNDPGLRARARAWLSEAGIGAERVEIEGDSSLPHFLEYLNGVDIALDPFPCGGETSALHCLWMGVPVVALEGSSLAGRLGSRVLRVAGLSAWVASSIDEYVAIARSLAGDPRALAKTRAGLRAHLEASPLLDHAGVTRDLEACYRELWREECTEGRHRSEAYAVNPATHAADAARPALAPLPALAPTPLEAGARAEYLGRPLEAAANYLAAAHDARTQAAALASLKRLLQHCAGQRSTLSELASLLRGHGFAALAVQVSMRALELEPGRVESYYSLSAALTDQGQAEAAVDACRSALRLDPDSWPAHSNLLFALHFQPHLPREQVFEEHRAFGQRLAASVRPEPRRAARLQPERQLRLGYVSPDLCAHPVAQFLEPVLAEHERSAFEVYCYSDTLRPDATTERLARLVDHFVPSGQLSHAQLSERIAADEIDVLVDLAGHTARNRLPVFARAPSPLQVSWLGYFDTTGLPAIQYRITDAQLVPAGAERYFVERIVRLPRSANCFQPAPGPAPLPPPLLARGHVTFGCFSNPSKIGRHVVAVFARILHELPGSRWIGKYRGLDDPEAQARLGGWFASEGISKERLEFRGASPLPEFLAAFADIDVALDPFPYGGETTALYTLWMGVPIVSLEGAAPAQRLTSRVLRFAGLEACIADTPERYVQLATELALDPARLLDWRSRLRERLTASPLFDARGVTRDLEAAYRQLWRDYCAQSAREAAASDP